ncbi:S10 family serine carboxypeptidase-like protein [Glacieibacterium sp.]|uniref:S10 family serine carboxypeptidase-like protein n=1 Tax=Glacieibacterium sp. TaxID=2860237 RepID=UPI003AFFD57F
MLGLAIAALAVPVSAEPPAIVTRHSITVAGRPLEYSAEAGRIAIRDVGTGEPLGHIFYVAYRVAPSPGKTRPLAFIWNGGPGLPAASTEFEGFGPRRIEGDHLVDNDDTLLTDADLVFVDPVGTGFSRAVSAAAQPAFTSIVGDVAAATEFVRAWVLQHGDEATPLILSGQSYGSGRAGSAAYQLLKRGFKVRGLALISNSSGLPQYPGQDLIATAMHVGDYAVAAHYYHKLSPTLGATPEAVRRSAEDWARRVYLPSLRRLASLSVAQRRQVAVELARHTGLAVSEIDIDKLIVTQGFFLGHLVPGKLPYYSDYRIFEPFHAPPLTIGLHSLRHDLGYHSDLPYLGIETLEDGFAPGGVYPKSVNALWLHSTVYGATPEQIHAAEVAWEARDVIGMPQYGANLPGAAEAIKLDPRLRVLVAHAAYDPLGGCSIDAELGRHLEPPFHEAIGFRCYLAGHAIYRDAPARALFADDLRRLARLASGETP